jgi:hypothetical protein
MNVHVTVPDTIEDLVSQYIRLRDKIKEAEDAHKAKLAPAKEYLEELNGRLLQRLNDVGGESVKTAHGTVYRTTRRSASIADGDAFRQFVINNEAFDLVDWRANANAVDDFIKEQAAPPPGVNFSTAFTVGVRRS